MNPRQRPLAIAAGVLLAVWALAMAGYVIARNAKVTAEKVRAYLTRIDLAKLNASDRAKALKKLAHDLNQLSADDRRKRTLLLALLQCCATHLVVDLPAHRRKQFCHSNRHNNQVRRLPSEPCQITQYSRV